MECFDVCIIGAGPCGISCAISAAQKGKSVILIEEGNYYLDRCCHVDDNGKCNDCFYCNVISGFGGCVHYGDSAKLSFYPSGKRLYKKIESDYGRILEYACSLWGVNKDEFVTESISNTSYMFRIKEYPVRVMTSDEIKRAIVKFDNLILSMEITRLNDQMVEIDISDDHFMVTTEKQRKFDCKNVVLATGRKGIEWIRENSLKLNMQISFAKPYIGFRFEMPKDYLIPLGKLHPDFKINATYLGYKYKTFCYCGGVHGGRLKFANYGDYTLLDGHILTETDTESEYGNFSLIRQLAKDNDYTVNVWGEVNKVLVEYQTISNGRPIYQAYSDFSKQKNTDKVNKISNDYVSVGPVYKLLKNGLTHYCEVAEAFFEFIADAAGVTMEEIVMNTNVVGLELEGLWDCISTDSFFMTSTNGLFVGGDCGGETQGILQATMMGIRIAEGIR